MKKIEILLVASCIFAITWSLLRFPGSGMLMVLSFSGLAIFYPVSSRKILADMLSAQQQATASLTGVTLSIASIGILFTCLYWPGGQTMMYISFLLISILLAVCMARQGQKQSPFYPQIMKRLIPFWIIALIFVVYPMAWTELKFRNYPGVIEAKREYYKNPDERTAMRELYELDKMNFPDFFEKLKIQVQESGEIQSFRAPFWDYRDTTQMRYYIEFLKEDELKGIK